MDINYLLLLQNMRPALGDIFTEAMRIITEWGEVATLRPIIACVYWLGYKRVASRVMYGFTMGSVINSWIKLSACVSRPWLKDPRIVPDVVAQKGATGYSFPSGHTAKGFQFFGTIADEHRHKNVIIPCCIMALLVGFSRNFLGVHTPQDVIVSAIISIALIFMTGKLFIWIENGKNHDLVFAGASLAIGGALIVFGTNEVAEYSTTADMLVNLQMGNVDALLLSDGFSTQLRNSGQYPDLEYFVIPQEVYVNRAGPVFHTQTLCDQYNEWFAGIKEDGTWQQIVNRWIGVPLPKEEDIPQFELTGKKGTLKMCDTGTYPPLTYYNDNGKLVGFNMDMMSRFAIHMGMKIEMATMDYHEIIPYVTSGKADMSACTLAITEDRQYDVIFGEPSAITQAVLIVRK